MERYNKLEQARKAYEAFQRDKLNRFISELRQVYDRIDNWKDPEEIEDMTEGLMDQFNTLIAFKSTRNPDCTYVKPDPPVKVKAISKALVATTIPDVCAICLNTHEKCDSITTDCGHQFGLQCWTSWSDITHGKPKCAMCNKQQPNITMFKPRQASHTRSHIRQPKRNVTFNC